VRPMNANSEVREFLMSRRANVTPEQAGLGGDGDRRVPGLRREEVAMLADVSVDYYTRLERGNIAGASAAVLEAVARALQLNDVERAHLLDLAGVTPRKRPDVEAAVRPSVQRILDSMAVPAIVVNVSQDIVASNLLGRALFAPQFDVERPNFARFIFLDSRARDFFDDWELACSLNAAMLRYQAGRDPLNEELTAIIGELSTRSPQFRQHWAQRDVHEHRSGIKIYNHPEFGSMEIAYEVFDLPGEPGLSIQSYTAEDGSPSAAKLALLASWATTLEAD
jgi:transcriptional regulator with XRE-family HTH domain